MKSLKSYSLISKDFIDKRNKNHYYKLLLNLVQYPNKPKNQTTLLSIKSNLKEYSKIPLMVLSYNELKPLLPNMDIDNTLIDYLLFLGIDKINGDYFTLNIYSFLKGLIGTLLHEIDFSERVDYLFKIYDRDNDGIITKSDISSLLYHFNEYNSLHFDKETLDGIVDILVKKMDKDKNGKIPKDDFSEFLLFYKDNPLTLNPFQKSTNFSIVIPREYYTYIDYNNINKYGGVDESIEDNRGNSKLGGLFVFLRLKIKNLIWLFIYLAFSCYIIYCHFRWEKRSSYKTYGHIGSRLALLNLSILLLMMCENFWTLIRGTFLFHVLPIDNINFNHQLAAIAFIISGFSHAIINATWGWMSSCEDVKCYLNKFLTIRGWTGIFMILIFTIMNITSIRSFRKKFYEAFCYIHKLFFVGIILLFFHHDNENLLKWTILPLVILIIEYIVRLIRFFIFKLTITSIKLLDGNIIELIVKKPKMFSFKPGQYARLQIPEISFFQWHAFTFASSPSEAEIIFYISPVGWWTKRLAEIGRKYINECPIKQSFIQRGLCLNEKEKNNLINCSLSNDFDSEEIIKGIVKDIHCRIDGPLGAPAQKYEVFNNLMLIAQGIGATPFSSILYQMLHSINIKKDFRFQSVDFYWVNKKKIYSQWLLKLLKDIMEADQEKKINFHLILTAPQQKYDFRSFFFWKGLELLKEENREMVSNYCGNIYWGRPNWNKLFLNKREELKYFKGKVGVFVCGNESFTSDVYKASQEYSGNGINFDFHKENF